MENVEEIIERISEHPGVKRIIITNAKKDMIKSIGFENLKPHELNARDFFTLVDPLLCQSRSVVREIDPKNDLQFLRIELNDDEILISPYENFTLIVLQEKIVEE